MPLQIASFELCQDTMIQRGWDAIHASYVEGFKNLPGGSKLEFTETHHSVVGEIVLSWGLWKFTIPGNDGKPMVSEGRFSDVKTKRDGKWVYVMDHASVPMGPPPAG